MWKTGTSTLLIQLGKVLLQRLGLIRKPTLFGGWPGRGPQAGAECFDLGHRVWHGGRPGLVVAGLRVGRCSTGPNHGILMLVD